MKMLENGVLDMTSTVLKLFFYTFQDCIQLTSFRKECFWYFLYQSQGLHQVYKIRKNEVHDIFEDFIMIFRANDDISMCSLLNYGKSVVKCLSDPLPPSKAGEPGL